jgi:hypothetical protein
MVSGVVRGVFVDFRRRTSVNEPVLALAENESLPFHGGNRGSNPRGDATHLTPLNTLHLALSLWNFRRNSIRRLFHAGSFTVTDVHVKTRRFTESFVDYSWTFLSTQRLSSARAARFIFSPLTTNCLVLRRRGC